MQQRKNVKSHVFGGFRKKNIKYVFSNNDLKIIPYTHFEIWTLWGHSFLSYAADKQTNKQTDRRTDRRTGRAAVMWVVMKRKTIRIRIRMQMFNVCNQKPTGSSLVYCTNQTKRLMETTKKTLSSSPYIYSVRRPNQVCREQRRHYSGFIG